MSESLAAAVIADGITENSLFEKQFETIKSLVNQGLNLDALEKAKQLWGDWHQWRLPKQLELLCTMLDNFGMERRTKLIRLYLWRKYQKKLANQQLSPETDAEFSHDHAINYGYYLLNYRSPLLVLEFIENYQHLANNDEDCADWLCLNALTHSQLRDFATAQRLIEQARLRLPDDKRIERTQVYLLSNEDKSKQALELALALYQVHPRLSMVAKTAKLIAINDNSLAAIAWLEGEIGQYQSVPAMLTLAHYYDGINDYDKCQLWLDKITDFYRDLTDIAADKDTQKWIIQLQASVHLGRLQYQQALEQFAQLKDHYSVVISDNIRQGLSQKIDLSTHTLALKVPQMAQKHLTCAPTTLVAISRFHGVAFNEDEVAAQICYGGTSSRNQNKWLTQNHFVYRSFDLTWALAVCLLDKGLPFTLVTGERMSSHLQAVIGYNKLTGTLLLMDPSCSCPVNMLAAQAIDKFAYLGPRCTVFVPEDKAYLLDDVEFVDEPLYRLMDQFENVCEQYQYAEAHQYVAQMVEYDPHHRISLEAQKQLAIINENEPQIYAHNAKLLERFPDDVALHVTAFVSLSNLGNKTQAIAELSARVLKYHEPDLMMMLFNQIRDISSEQAFADFLRNKIRRYCWSDAEALWVQAHHLWDKQAFNAATDYYRFALCCGETTEKYVESYFKAARAVGKTDEALTLLRQRFEQHSGKSSSPCISLYCALEMLDQEHQGIEVLEQGVHDRPDDTYLLYYYLNKLLFNGLIDQFNQVKQQKLALLEDELQRQLQVKWLRHLGEIDKAIEQQLYLHKQKPLSYSFAQGLFELQRIAQCQSDIDQRLDELNQQYGDYRAVIWLTAVWHSDSQLRLNHWQRLIELFGYDLNNYQNYIDELLAEHQSAKALEMVIQLLEKAQDKTYYQELLARVLLSCGDWQGAKEAAQHAIVYNADNEYAQDHLLNASLGLIEKSEACQFIAEQLLNQNIHGNGISHFWHHGEQWLSKAQLKQYCDQMLQKHSHCWQAWLISSKSDKSHLGIEQSIAKIKQAIDKFPLASRLFVELAELYQHQQQVDLAIEQLNQVCTMFPSWPYPAKQLSTLYEHQGDFDNALQVLAKVAKHNIEDGSVLGMMADMEYRTGYHTKAIESLKLAIKREMSYPWAWDCLSKWSRALNGEDQAWLLANQLCEKMPHIPVCWLNLANVTDDHQQKLTLLLKALALNETNEKIHIALINCYIASQEYDKAIEQINADCWHQEPPLAIRLKHGEILQAKLQLGQACQHLKQIVDKHPNCKTAWSMLSNSYRHFGKYHESIEAVKQLVDIDPFDSSSLSVAGQTIIDVMDDKAQKEQLVAAGHDPAQLLADAREYLANAFLFSPSISEYGLVYLDVLLMDLERAIDSNQESMIEQIKQTINQTVDLMEKFQQCAYLLVRKIQLDCYCNHGDESLAWWRQIIESKEESNWIYMNAGNALFKTKYDEVTIACLDDAIRHDECAMAAAPVWVRFLLASQKRKQLIEFIEQNPDSQYIKTIINEYISLLFNKPEGFERQSFEPIEHLIATDDDSCGRYGYLLSLAESRKACIEWFEQHQVNHKMPAFVLHHLFWIYQDTAQYAASSAALNAALEAELDGSYENLALLHANERFIAGELVSRDDLVDINYEGLTVAEKYIFVLLLAVADSQGHEDFNAMIKVIEPMLRDAQMLNQQVSEINLCIRTRKATKNWLYNLHPPSGWLANLKMKFTLFNYF